VLSGVPQRRRVYAASCLRTVCLLSSGAGQFHKVYLYYSAQQRGAVSVLRAASICIQHCGMKKDHRVGFAERVGGAWGGTPAANDYSTFLFLK